MNHRQDRRPALNMTESLKAQIFSACEKCYPEEACGILVGRRDENATYFLEKIVVSKNILSERKVDRYLLDPLDQGRAEIEASKAGLEVIGFYHSHPDVAAIPSKFDLEQAWPDYIYLICEVRQGKACALNGFTLDLQDGDKHYFVPLDLKPMDEPE
jgi:proteasome lid subunit RPN8/RPN11